MKVCRDCKAEYDGERSLCDGCLSRARERMREIRAAKKESGVKKNTPAKRARAKANRDWLSETMEYLHSRLSSDQIKSLGQHIVELEKPRAVESQEVATVKLSDGGISTPVNCSLDTVLTWRGVQLNKRSVESLTIEQRQEAVADLFVFFKQYNFDRLIYSEKSLRSDYSAAKNSADTLVQKDGAHYISNQSSSGMKFCRYMFPNVIKVASRSNPSVYDAINDDEKLRRILLNRMTINAFKMNGKPEYFNITPAMIIQGAKSSGISCRASYFKPTVAKSIYRYWCKPGDRIYDYSSGFGARLLGFHTSGIPDTVYYGTDPNTETYSNLQNMTDKLNISARIYNLASEKLLIDEKFDFVFSSPPYFDKELYCDEPTQCYNNLSDYTAWLEGYWRKTVQNIAVMMRDGAVFGVNIGNNSNPEMQRVLEDANRIVAEEGLTHIETWYMTTSKAHFSKDKSPKLEPICFYRKV